MDPRQLRLFKENVKIQRVKRDCALDNLEVTRLYLINFAKDLASKLAGIKGTVTSSEVLFVLRDQVPEMLEKVDPRFMGAVFRSGWVRVGFDHTGSHCRPVSRWKLQGAA